MKIKLTEIAKTDGGFDLNELTNHREVLGISIKSKSTDPDDAIFSYKDLKAMQVDTILAWLFKNPESVILGVDLDMEQEDESENEEAEEEESK